MANLNLLTQQQYRAFLGTLVANYSTQPASDAAGEPLDAILNAVALLAVQQQGNIVLAAAASRLKTSGGFDVDTFCAPFGIFRLIGVAASGTAVLGTSAPLTQPLTIPFGTTLQSTSGALYTVVADPTQPGYTAAGYVIQVGQNSVAVTVQCTQTGTLGNADAGTITSMVAGPGSGPPVPGISSIFNPAGFTNGQDDESDPAMIARFGVKASSGNVATSLAILGAVLDLQPGLTVSYGDQLQPNGVASVPGSYSVVVNVLGQTTGPSPTLLAGVNGAIDTVRSAGDQVFVSGPTLYTPAIAGSILIVPGFDPVLTTQAANAAAVAFVNSLGLDAMGNPVTLSIGRLAQAILKVAGVADVIGLTLDGALQDIIAPFGVQLVATTSGLVAGLPTGVIV